MSYFVRILGTQDPDIDLNEMLETLAAGGHLVKCFITKDEGPEKWTMLQVDNASGVKIVEIERNPIVEGNWNCAVLNESGRWQSFAMDLGNQTQRLEFQEGRVPREANRI